MTVSSCPQHIKHLHHFGFTIGHLFHELTSSFTVLDLHSGSNKHIDFPIKCFKSFKAFHTLVVLLHALDQVEDLLVCMLQTGFKSDVLRRLLNELELNDKVVAFVLDDQFCGQVVDIVGEHETLD